MNTYSFAMFISRQNERCKSIPVFLIPITLNLGIFIVGLESCHEPRYANGVHPHGELALVGYLSLAHIVRFGLFLCVIPLCVSIFMVKLEGDTFECAGTLVSQSTNPLWLCHPHLVVNGKASINSLGAH